MAISTKILNGFLIIKSSIDFIKYTQFTKIKNSIPQSHKLHVKHSVSCHVVS